MFKVQLNELGIYEKKNFKGKKVSEKAFKKWFQNNRLALERDHLVRSRNMLIAHNLIDIFQGKPEIWNVIRYLNIRGPVTWGMEQDFEIYLHGWWLRTPTRWQKHVVQIAGRFGVDPTISP